MWFVKTVNILMVFTIIVLNIMFLLAAMIGDVINTKKIKEVIYLESLYKTRRKTRYG